MLGYCVAQLVAATRLSDATSCRHAAETMHGRSTRPRRQIRAEAIARAAASVQYAPAVLLRGAVRVGGLEGLVGRVYAARRPHIEALHRARLLHHQLLVVPAAAEAEVRQVLLKLCKAMRAHTAHSMSAAPCTWYSTPKPVPRQHGTQKCRHSRDVRPVPTGRSRGRCPARRRRRSPRTSPPAPATGPAAAPPSSPGRWARPPAL